MTIDVNLVTVADSIAALNVSGVNVRDIDQIPESALPILPVLYLRPNEFITNLKWSRETYGTDATAAMNLTYVLHYHYLHAVVGSAGSLLSVYSGLITNLIKILKAIFEDSNPDGAVDMTLVSISSVGVLTDPAGEVKYHGVEISLQVTEYIQ